MWLGGTLSLSNLLLLVLLARRGVSWMTFFLLRLRGSSSMATCPNRGLNVLVSAKAARSDRFCSTPCLTVSPLLSGQDAQVLHLVICVRPALATTSFRMRQASAILASVSVQKFIAPGCLHPWSANGRWQGVVTILSWMGAQPVIVPCISHAFMVPMTGAYVMTLRRSPIFSSLRSTWLQRPHSLGTCGVDRLADDMFLRLIFSTCVVAGICQAQRSLWNGIEAHGASSELNDAGGR